MLPQKEIPQKDESHKELNPTEQNHRTEQKGETEFSESLARSLDFLIEIELCVSMHGFKNIFW